jgi:hypothetical protein
MMLGYHRLFDAAVVPWDPLTDLPGLRWLVHTDDANRVDVHSGPVGSAAFTLTGVDDIQLTDSGAAFAASGSMVNQHITIAGATSPGNNGTFRVEARASATALVWTQPARVAESFPGTYATHGKCDAIVDRLSSIPFAQATPTNRPTPEPTQKAGHYVFSYPSGTATQRRYADATHAVAADFDTAPALTLACYANVVTASANDFLAVTNGVGTYLRAIRFGTFAGGLRLVVTDAGGTSTLTYTGALTGWALYAATYDGAGTASFYKDGVLLGTDTDTTRTPSSLTDVILGQEIAPAGEAYHGVYAGCIGELSPADQVLFSTWCASSFA